MRLVTFHNLRLHESLIEIMRRSIGSIDVPPPDNLTSIFKSSSFKFLSPPGQNRVQMPHPSGTVDNQRPHLSCKHFLRSHLLAKVNSKLSNTLLKVKTHAFRWKDLVVPVQIPHRTQTRFKFPIPRDQETVKCPWLAGWVLKLRIDRCITVWRSTLNILLYKGCFKSRAFW